MSYTHEDMSAHYITHAATDESPMGVTFIAVSHGLASRRATFILLMQMERQYKETSGKINVAAVKRLCENAESGQSDTMGLARAEIDQVKNIMIENVERVLERGERINLLVSKTDRMNNNAVAFRKRSVAVQRRMRWQNIKFSAILCIFGLAVLYLIVGIECGLPGFQHCF